MNTCNLGDIRDIKGLLGIDEERISVWVATLYSDRYKAVGARAFSTKEKALAYKCVVDKLPNRITGNSEVKIRELFIDETMEETRARCEYRF